MNRDQVYDMAKEAGFDWHAGFAGDGELNRFEVFAALVRAEVMREMADSGHSTARAGEASTAPLPEGEAATARELAAMFRQFTKSSHRWHDGRSVHIVAAEVLEHFANAAGWIPVSERLPEFAQDCDWLFPRSETKRERWILCGESQMTASVPGRATHWCPAEPLPSKAGVTKEPQA